MVFARLFLLLVALLVSAEIATAQDYKAFYNEGVSAFRNGDYHKAIDAFDKALALEKGDPDIWYNRGCAKSMIGNYTSSIRDFDEAIALNPEFIDAYYNRGSVRSYLNDHDGVIADMTEVIKRDRDYAEAFATRGQLYFDKEEQALGCRDLKSAYELGYDGVKDFITIYCNIPEYFSAVRWFEIVELDWSKLGQRSEITQYQDIEIQSNVQSLKLPEGEVVHTHEQFWCNYVNIPFAAAMAEHVEASQRNGASGKLKELERLTAKEAKYPWVLYTLEGADSTGAPEAQLWIMIQGEKGMYLCGLGIKGKKLPKAILSTWREFLLTHKVVRT